MAWRSMESDPPDGAGGQVWVAYPNPNHPDGWNLVVEWTPVSPGTRHLAPEPMWWCPIDRPTPPGEPPAPPEIQVTRAQLEAMRVADLDAQAMANCLYNIPHRVRADGAVEWTGRDSDALTAARLRWESSSLAARDAISAALAAPVVPTSGEKPERCPSCHGAGEVDFKGDGFYDQCPVCQPKERRR